MDDIYFAQITEERFFNIRYSDYHQLKTKARVVGKLEAKKLLGEL